MRYPRAASSVSEPGARQLSSRLNNSDPDTHDVRNLILLGIFERTGAFLRILGGRWSWNSHDRSDILSRRPRGREGKHLDGKSGDIDVHNVASSNILSHS